jgi:hypothetical protein
MKNWSLETVFHGGAHFETNGEPLVVTAFAPGIFRIHLGKRTGPDYHILTGEADPPQVQFTTEAAYYQLVSSDLTLHLTQDLFCIRLLREEQVLLQSVTDAHFTRPFRLPCYRTCLPSIVIETLGNVNAQIVEEGIILTTH